MRCLFAGQDDKFTDTLMLAPNNFPILLSNPKYVKGEEEIFTVLDDQGKYFHCAGSEGCGYQTG